MNEIGLIIIKNELVILLGTVLDQAMDLVGPGTNPTLYLDLDCVPWIELILEPLRDLLGPCSRKASLDRHRPVFVSLSQH